MRRVAALIGLCASGAGCDQIFGLKETLPQDAPGDGMPVLKHGQPVQLTYLAYDSYVATTHVNTAVTTPAMPITDIQVGTINDTTLMTLEPATMDDDGNALPPGSYLVPGDIFGMVISDDDTVQPPWRLVIPAVPGGREGPTELQWKPHPGQAHWVMPLLGRADAPTPDPNAGFTITPTGAGVPTMQSGSHVLTTGVFTDGTIGFDTMPSVDYSFALGRPMAGPKGKAPSTNDVGFLTTYGPGTGQFTQCRASTGNAEFQIPDLSTATHAEVSHAPPWGPWNSALNTTGTYTVDTTEAISRVDDVLMGGSVEVHLDFGYTPTIALPFFLAHTDDDSHSILNANMFTLSDCPLTLGGANQPLPPWSEPDLMHVLMTQILRVSVVERRTLTSPTANGTEVDSGMEVAVTNGGTANTFSVTFPVAFPTALRLTTSASMTDLSLGGASTDGMHVAVGTGLVTLDITPETGMGSTGAYVADYYQIALVSPNSETGQIDTIRTFITAEPKMQFDASNFTPGTEYLFEVRAYRGTPNAKLGDFITQEYPQAVASAYTHSFIAE